MNRNKCCRIAEYAGLKYLSWAYHRRIQRSHAAYIQVYWLSVRLVNIKRSTLQKLAEVLDVLPADLLDDQDDSQAKPITITNNGTIPILGRIPAGTPIDAIEDIQGYVDVPASWVDTHSALKVIGDSMSPKYLDGDIIIFREQPDCENGQDCVAVVNGFDATLKKVVKTDTGIILQPLNPLYEPIICGSDNPITILGVVVELRRKV